MRKLKDYIYIYIYIYGRRFNLLEPQESGVKDI